MRKLFVVVLAVAWLGATPAVEAATPVGTSVGPGVQPGGEVRTDRGQCTLNFLFQGSDGRRYIGTAGHCILEGSQVSTGGDATQLETTWPVGSGPVAKDSLGARLGEFAYATLQDPRDFALIRLDPEVKASPQMAHFGGPTGINTDASRDRTVLEWYGNGVGFGATVPARSAVAFGLPDPDRVVAFGVAGPGDSGSGVISADGRAVGVLVTVGVNFFGATEDGVNAGDLGITRLGPQLTRAQELLGLQLNLETAPVK